MNATNGRMGRNLALIVPAVAMVASAAGCSSTGASDPRPKAPRTRWGRTSTCPDAKSRVRRFTSVPPQANPHGAEPLSSLSAPTLMQGVMTSHMERTRSAPQNPWRSGKIRVNFRLISSTSGLVSVPWRPPFLGWDKGNWID
jgi:hypothetical protein